MKVENPITTLKSQELFPSGIPSLDAVIGGGFPKGSLVILYNDNLAVYSDMFLKIFLAQGIVKKDDILLASCDTSPQKFLSELPQEGSTNNANDGFKLSNEPLQIAWRYETNMRVNATEISASSFSSSFHFRDRLPSVVVQSAHTECYPCQGFSCTLESLLERIHHRLNAHNHMNKLSSKKTVRNILRVGIHNLGSLFWQEAHCKLPDFLYRLRALLHNSDAIAFITLPKYLIEESKIICRCEHISDLVMELKSLTVPTNGIYDDINGFIRFNKISALNSLSTLVKDDQDWAFKFSHKKLVVEKFRLPPEMESSDQREQDHSTQTSCFKSNNKLEF
ncbi:hypothetical protein O3M35_006788 [Rhynocoris fuscipes]|uniref:Elongator complex protein 4 n=1 Tax=Rhynocoris fuscipes TaxID=488301 RepID=A0AAW1DJZ8_9HEMI